VVDAKNEDIKDSGVSVWVSANFEEDRQTCKAKLGRIVAECRRANEKYRDKQFDIEADDGLRYCLDGLLQTKYFASPRLVKRV
jgi:hypothetical protein